MKKNSKRTIHYVQLIELIVLPATNADNIIGAYLFLHEDEE